MRRTRAVAAAAVIAVAVAGCGGTTGGGGGGDSVATLSMGTPVIPTSLIPTSDPTVTQTMSIQYGSTLLAYAEQEEGQTQLASPEDNQPALATEFERTPEGIEFTLREAKSSAGNPLDPEDVVFSYERMVATEDPIGTFVMTIAGMDLENPVTVIDDRTVRLNGANTPLGLLAAIFPYMMILDKELVTEGAPADDEWNTDFTRTNSASFGPYDIQNFRPGEQMVLRANPEYWGEAPAYESVTLLATSTQQVSQLVRSGSLQWASSLPNRDYAELKDAEGLHSTVSATNVQNVLQLGPNLPALADPLVRQAISRAIDREQLADKLYNGVAKPARGPVSAAAPGLADIESEFYEHDVDAAKALLADSGFADGFSFEVVVNKQSIKRVDPATLAVALREMLTPLGIEVTVREVTNNAEFQAGLAKGQYDAYLSSEGPAVADMAYALSTYHKTTAVQNYTKHGSPELDAAIEAAAATPLGPERDALAAVAVEMFNEAMYSVPLVDESDAYVASTEVCGFATFPYMATSAANLAPCE